MRLVIVFVITFAIVSALEALAHFHYSPFSEPFSLRKLCVDTGLWLFVWVVCSVVVRRVEAARGRSRGGPSGSSAGAAPNRNDS